MIKSQQWGFPIDFMKKKQLSQETLRKKDKN